MRTAISIFTHGLSVGEGGQELVLSGLFNIQYSNISFFQIPFTIVVMSSDLDLYLSPNSNVIDSMEKEQEGIVMKLMHEINALKEENKYLKNQLRSSSTSSSSSSSISLTTSPVVLPSLSFNSLNPQQEIPSLSLNSNPLSAPRRPSVSTISSIKRVPNTIPNTLPIPHQSPILTPTIRSRSNSMSVKSPSVMVSFDTDIFNSPTTHISSTSKRRNSSLPTCFHRRSGSENNPTSDAHFQSSKLQVSPKNSKRDENNYSDDNEKEDGKDRNNSNGESDGGVSPGLLL